MERPRQLLDNYILEAERLQLDKEQLIFISQKGLEEVRNSVECMKEGAIAYKSLSESKYSHIIDVSVNIKGHTLHFTTKEKFINFIENKEWRRC